MKNYGYSKSNGTGLNKHVPSLRDEFLTPFDSIFDKMVNQAFPNFGQEFGVNFFGNSSYPRVNVADTSKEVRIEAEIAGLGKEDVSVEYADGMLTISGDKKTENEDLEVKYVYKELKRSSFKRSFKVDDATLDVNKISAKFDNGILNVTIPKREVIETKAKKVKIL
ncbi:MAG: Hsp20/alpha crystallin family protein [Flavobacteriia bacterium]|nr:Hsp20/alpha crystallin family protein [Flavobacteriia bacterium]